MIFIISEKGEQINEAEKLEILAHIGRRTSYLLGRNKHCEPLRSIVTRDILGQLKHEYGCGFIVLTMARAKRKERIEQYETGKRESNNSTGLH